MDYLPKKKFGQKSALIVADQTISDDLNIAVPIQMRYNIISRGVGARHCRAPTDVPHVNEKRYNFCDRSTI